MEDRVEAVCDLLMGAAYADENLHEKEKKAVESHLKTLLPDGKMTPAIQARVNDFDPKDFDLEEVAKAFTADGKADRVKLLDLVASIHAADDEHDFAEDDYLRSVAKALGLKESESKEHVLVYEVETLKEYLAALRPPPPPPPAKSK